MRCRSRADRAGDTAGRVRGNSATHFAGGFIGGSIRGERGSITAEFAAVMPAVLLILITALGAMQLAGEQLRLQSATNDAARILARGDTGATARVAAAVRGATLTQSRRDDLVCAEARAPTSLGILSAITLSAEACALDDAQ